MPNFLLDQLLPTLKDTELRVMLVVLRQTTGYNRDEKPVSISYRSLKEKTGRESAAIASALNSLADRRLIHFVARKQKSLIRNLRLDTVNPEEE